MSLQFPGFLRVVLPTFILLYAFAGSAFHPEPRHRQVFGNRDYFMELLFDTSPSIAGRSLVPYLKFSGELVSDKLTQTVTGFLARSLGKTTYHMRVGAETWEGLLKAVPSSCDGYLELSNLKTGHRVSPNRLKAGFCVEL